MESNLYSGCIFWILNYDAKFKCYVVIARVTALVFMVNELFYPMTFEQKKNNLMPCSCLTNTFCTILYQIFTILCRFLNLNWYRFWCYFKNYWDLFSQPRVIFHWANPLCQYKSVVGNFIQNTMPKYIRQDSHFFKTLIWKRKKSDHFFKYYQ